MSTTHTQSAAETGPTQIDGPPAAGLIAAGIGAATLGLFVTLAEASTGIKDFLQWNDRVGPLSGKTVLAAIAYFSSFLVLGFWWRGKTFALRSILVAAAILVVLGLVFTFPPVFQAFASE
ncbi:MAG TPA: hypothetical protein VFR38_10420 [Gaiellaceae bacterium]|nr:hypothetical protein [Gaiellaceae bacterium]